MAGDRLVTVRHPAPMELRLKRRRTWERGFVATTTPAVLRSGSPEDLGRAHVVRTSDDGRVGAFTWREFEGALWYQVGGLTLGGVPSPDDGPFGLALFEAFLADTPRQGTLSHTDASFALHRTPLLAFGVGARAATRGVDAGLAGEPPGGLRITEIREDGRAAAAAALARFMDERVRVVGDAVLVRTCAPLLGPDQDAWSVQPFPQLRDMGRRLVDYRLRNPLGFRADALREGLEWDLSRRDEDQRHESRRQAARRRGIAPPENVPFAGAPYGDETALLVAGDALTAAVNAFECLEKEYAPFARHGMREAEAAPAYALCDELLGLATRASVGGIGMAEAPHAVDLARRMAGAVEAYFTWAGILPEVWETRLLCDRFEALELPLAPGAMPAADDADDLDALATLRP